MPVTRPRRRLQERGERDLAKAIWRLRRIMKTVAVRAGALEPPTSLRSVTAGLGVGARYPPLGATVSVCWDAVRAAPSRVICAPLCATDVAACSQQVADVSDLNARPQRPVSADPAAALRAARRNSTGWTRYGTRQVSALPGSCCGARPIPAATGMGAALIELSTSALSI